MNNHVTKVHIFKEYHKFVVGRNGVNLKKIREETNTRIALPGRGSNDDEFIVITGQKRDTETAREMIEAIQKEYVNIFHVYLSINNQYLLIG